MTTTMKANAKNLRLLETHTRRLLAKVGRVSEQYDSARVAEALGHLSQAADALRQAAHVLAARERALQ